MSADLDQLFGSLRADSDRIPLPLAAGARARGGRRRRNSVIASVLAVALVAAGVTSGLLLTGREDVTLPPARVNFVPLEQVGPGVSGEFPGRTFVWGQAAGGDAYFTWRSETTGQLMVAGVQLPTGKPAWPARELGKYGDFAGSFLAPGVLGVMGERDDGSPLDRRLHVVDLSTGQERWALDFDINQGGDLTPTTGGLLVTGENGGQLRLLDWASGKALWTMPSSQGTVVATTVATAEALDNRPLVLQAPDGALSLLTLPDMQPRPLGQRMQGRLTVIGGRVYASTEGGPVTVLDLAGGAPRPFHTPANGARAGMIQPCGPGLVCVQEESRTGEAMMVLDAATGARKWQVGGDYGRGRGGPVSTVGDRILGAEGMYSPSGKLLYRSGQAILSPVGPAAALAIQYPGSPGMGGGDQPVQVSGVDASDGHVTPLGTIRAGYGCVADNQYLACPDAAGFKVWRFSK
ncbi:PQQ-binding-like beta-propeller repeat protein [Longispora albida]|uniref:outer membrane protein assembly factor BamB family protein n=1 Tax=Longispora albida TaxID=203523 RepID=UPI00036C4653|nr:PQQ-binding-like beta-propeller repeat protein [Longispora albida]